MYPEPAAPLPRIGKETLIPALVCAGICIVSVRAGLLSLFFLVPLGVCAVVFGPAAAWLSVVCAVCGNAAVSAAFAAYRGAGMAGSGLSVLYFAVMSLGFTWIMAGGPPENRWMPAIPRVRTLFRFTAAAAAGALAFMGLTALQGGKDALRSLIEAAYTLYITSPGVDAAQRALIEQTLTADRMTEVFYAAFLYGGAVFLAFFEFFYSRHLAFVVARLFRRPQQRPSGLIDFHAPRRAVGVFSLCLPAVLLCRVVSLGALEIAAWNILVICAIMFLAQGGGIVLFNLARRPMPMIVRLIGIVLFICVLFSPGINVLALAALILLGIAENWLPLRVTKDVT